MGRRTDLGDVDPGDVVVQPHPQPTVARSTLGRTLLMTLMVAGFAATATAAVPEGPRQIATVAAAQAGGTAGITKPPGEQFHRTELFFGQDKPSGGEVTEEDFAKFLDVEVTPRFPDGVTLLSALGQFTGSTGLVEEQSKILILFYPLADPDANREIEEIRAVYKDLFDQDSVLRVNNLEQVSF